MLQLISLTCRTFGVRHVIYRLQSQTSSQHVSYNVGDAINDDIKYWKFDIVSWSLLTRAEDRCQYGRAGILYEAQKRPKGAQSIGIMNDSRNSHWIPVMRQYIKRRNHQITITANIVKPDAHYCNGVFIAFINRVTPRSVFGENSKCLLRAIFILS